MTTRRAELAVSVGYRFQVFVCEVGGGLGRHDVLIVSRVADATLPTGWAVGIAPILPVRSASARAASPGGAVARGRNDGRRSSACDELAEGDAGGERSRCPARSPST